MRTGKPGLAGSCYALWSKMCHVNDVIKCGFDFYSQRVSIRKERFWQSASRPFHVILIYLILCYEFHPRYEWIDSTYSYLFSWRDFTARIQWNSSRSSSHSLPWKPFRRGHDCLLSGLNDLLDYYWTSYGSSRDEVMDSFAKARLLDIRPQLVFGQWSWQSKHCHWSWCWGIFFMLARGESDTKGRFRRHQEDQKGL